MLNQIFFLNLRNIKTNDMEALIIILAILTAFVFIALYFILRKSAALQYEEDLIYLRAFINRVPVTEANFWHILGEFKKLYTNNQDKVKTAELWVKFAEKYMMFCYTNKEFDEIASKIK